MWLLIPIGLFALLFYEHYKAPAPAVAPGPAPGPMPMVPPGIPVTPLPVVPVSPLAQDGQELLAAKSAYDDATNALTQFDADNSFGGFNSAADQATTAAQRAVLVQQQAAAFQRFNAAVAKIAADQAGT